MIRSIVMEPVAVDQAARLLSDDPEGLRAVLAAIDRLPMDPFPAASFALGSPLRRRMRVGAYRVYFAVEDDVVRVVRMGRADGL